ncbi:putative HIT-like protein [Ceratocystis lukuohia]|uniref:HIT-like protein n=2 Tax=Ceratocystis TaxID=5157 RepID=A0ABR4MHE3_9PEZI|nr:putative HIT-like protein [Ceratocystis platani]
MALDVSSPCPFCRIVCAYPPYNPRFPPPASSNVISSTKISPNAFVVLSTPSVVAFLDIMPLARGHILLSPRNHKEKFTNATPAEAAELGRNLLLLSRALTRALGVYDWNVVQNNGAAAAQVVPHIHFHLIPRPEIRQSGRFSESFTMFGRGTREDLDEADAEVLADKVRQSIAEVLTEMETTTKL